MNNVLTELQASNIPTGARPFVYALCMGEGGIDSNAWLRCYGGQVLSVPLTTVFNSANPLWAGKDNSHALGAGQFQPATYEETAKRTGLTTLEPQSQLANIWSLAKVAYRGNLEADLAAGKALEIAPLLKSTWTSLGLPAFATHYAAAVKVLAAAPPAQPAPPPTASDLNRQELEGLGVTPAPQPQPQPVPPAGGLQSGISAPPLAVPQPAPAPAPAQDPELQAMADMVEDLLPLSAAARQRVLAYVASRFAA